MEDKKYPCEDCRNYGGSQYAECTGEGHCDMKEPKPSNWEARDG